MRSLLYLSTVIRNVEIIPPIDTRNTIIYDRSYGIKVVWRRKQK